MEKALAEVKNCALGLLTRREHSQCELRNKLRLRKFDTNLIDIVIQELIEQGLQNDQRFVENYIQMRSNRGYGPVRIAAELNTRGINEELIAQHLNETDPKWLEIINQVQRKKFGSKIPKDFSERAKQLRFLQYRGFTLEQIAHSKK